MPSVAIKKEEKFVFKTKGQKSQAEQGRYCDIGVLK